MFCRFFNLIEEENWYNVYYCRWIVEMLNFIIKLWKLIIINILWFYSIRELVLIKIWFGFRYFDWCFFWLMIELGWVELNFSWNYEIFCFVVNVWFGGLGVGCMFVMVWIWVFLLFWIFIICVFFFFFL